jgi:hypothetical protein
MSLKCSLLGHVYGDTEVRRERKEDGSELVETVREVKVCERCGETLVVSETTEVTTVEAANDVEGTARDAGSTAGTVDRGDTSDTGRSGGTPRGAGATGPPGDGVDRSGTGGGTGRGDAGSARGPGDAGSSGAPTDAGGGPEITDPQAGGTDGTGPESSGSDTTATGTPGGSLDDSQERDMPPARKDDAIIIDEDGEERPGSEWPQEDDEEADDWEPETDPETDGETDTRKGTSPGSSGGLTVPEGEFHCPECGFATAVESSSLREGDFCPECHRGALEHRSG